MRRMTRREGTRIRVGIEEVVTTLGFIPTHAHVIFTSQARAHENPLTTRNDPPPPSPPPRNAIQVERRARRRNRKIIKETPTKRVNRNKRITSAGVNQRPPLPSDPRRRTKPTECNTFAITFGRGACRYDCSPHFYGVVGPVRFASHSLSSRGKPGLGTNEGEGVTSMKPRGVNTESPKWRPPPEVSSIQSTSTHFRTGDERQGRVSGLPNHRQSKKEKKKRSYGVEKRSGNKTTARSSAFCQRRTERVRPSINRERGGKLELLVEKTKGHSTLPAFFEFFLQPPPSRAEDVLS